MRQSNCFVAAKVRQNIPSVLLDWRRPLAKGKKCGFSGFTLILTTTKLIPWVRQLPKTQSSHQVCVATLHMCHELKACA